MSHLLKRGAVQVENKGPANDRYRWSAQEPLTQEQTAAYINLMAEIREKLSEIRAQLDSDLTHSVPTTVKIVYLHFREITEMLIDCLLIVRNTQNHNIDLSRKLRTTKKIKWLNTSQKEPYFIPLEWPQETGSVFRSIYDGKLYNTDVGNMLAIPYNPVFNQKEKDYLTLSNLETLHDKCNSALHTTPPFSKGIDYNEYMESAKNWCDRIEQLIALHKLITETEQEKDKRIYLYQHISKENGQSHLYILEPHPPGSDWIYNPKTK